MPKQGPPLSCMMKSLGLHLRSGFVALLDFRWSARVTGTLNSCFGVTTSQSSSSWRSGSPHIISPSGDGYQPPLYLFWVIRDDPNFGVQRIHLFDGYRGWLQCSKPYRHHVGSRLSYELYLWPIWLKLIQLRPRSEAIHPPIEPASNTSLVAVPSISLTKLQRSVGGECPEENEDSKNRRSHCIWKTSGEPILCNKAL